MNEPKRPTIIPERKDDDEDEDEDEDDATVPVFIIFFCQVGEFVVDKKSTHHLNLGLQIKI